MHRRFFCENIPGIGEALSLSDSESRHLRTILRAKSDDKCLLIDGHGHIAEAQLLPTGADSNRAKASCVILTKVKEPPPRTKFVLFISPPRTKGMGRIIRQSIELGVWKICPIITQYSTAKPNKASLNKWSQDAREACKQSGNPFLPTIHAAERFDVALAMKDVYPGIIGTVQHRESQDLQSHHERKLQILIQALRRQRFDTLSLWIGPEGGFAKEETTALLQRGVLPIAVGLWTLRVETAVVATLTCLHQICTSIDNV